MPASEPLGEDKRLALLSRLIESLGEEEARTLMESLPPVLWTHLATKDDLRALEDRIRTDFDGKFTQLLATITSEFAKGHSELPGLRGEIASNRGEIADNRAEATLQFAKQTRTMVVTLIGFAITIWITLLATGLS